MNFKWFMIAMCVVFLSLALNDWANAWKAVQLAKIEASQSLQETE